MASYSPYEQLLTLLPAAQEKRVLAAGSAILHEGPLKSTCALSASGERAADAADTVDIQLSQADALGSHARLHGPTVFESRLEAGRQVPGGVIPAGMHVSHELLQARWPLLVTAGLHDMRVPYWGPAKYAALLRQLRSMVFCGSEAEKKREESTMAGEVLLMVNLGAGHFASSGAGQRLSERALKYAFLLSALGLLER